VARPGCGIELTTRTDGADLAPFAPDAKPVDLLRAEAELDTWRIVEVFSRSGYPFDVSLEWSAGRGAGASALVTVSRSARISIFARSVRVVATNLSNQENRVVVTVADGFAPTRNQWEHKAHLVASDTALIPIPPFAETVRIDLADASLAPTSVIRVVDGLDTNVATHLVSDQPARGIPIGGAADLELTVPSDTDFRAVFHLSL
jgi:hypothetical protein